MTFLWENEVVTVSWGVEFVVGVFVSDILLGAEMALIFWSVSLFWGMKWS